MKLISQRDALQIAQSGAKEFRFGPDTRLTPGARDVFSESGVKVIFEAPGAPATNGAGPAALADSSSRFHAILHSHEAEELKRQIIDIGKRLWMREYTDGNGGNISARLGDHFLCTPTGVSKGFLTPEMICLVDADGTQLACNGAWRRTSEINTHLAIYRAVPEAKAVVHAHPVHATAFAITGFEPPPCLIPEIEVFVGRVPIAPYRFPGSAEMAEVIMPLAPKHQSILMGNHGLICWGTGVEDAYFKMEITDAYCRTLWVASALPNRRTTIPADSMKQLIDLKTKLGLPDSREGLEPVKLCEIDPWVALKDGTSCACTAAPAATPSAPAPAPRLPADTESLIQRITDEILKSLTSNQT